MRRALTMMPQQHDRLHVLRMGEHVHRRYALYAVAACPQDGKVAYLGDGVARDVRDVLWPEAQNTVQELRRRSGAWWIKNNGIEAVPLLGGHPLRGIGTGIAAVAFQAICLRVATCAAYGVTYLLDACYLKVASILARSGSGANANGAGTTIGVEQGGRICDALERQRVQHLSLNGIRLIEACWANLEGAAQQFVVHDSRSKQDAVLRT